MAVANSHPDNPDVDLAIVYDLASTPDNVQDRPACESGPPLKPGSQNSFPPVILGCASFTFGSYTTEEVVRSNLTLRVIRLALRCGINAFDTAPLYHPSEVVLGQALDALRSEYPRETYKIITKCGAYGDHKSEHDYKPETLKKSIERSLVRLRTDYLDAVYLHDVEFLVTEPFPCPSGNPLDALAPLQAGKPKRERPWFLSPPYQSLGEGDDRFLAALAVLRDYKARGKVRRIGIAGLSLPLMLRLSLLALHTAPYEPLDMVQTYNHHTLLNDTLTQYLPYFTDLARVSVVTNAAPLSQGVLTDRGPPEWNPLRNLNPEGYAVTREAAALCASGGTTLSAVASHFGYKPMSFSNGQKMPTVLGCQNLEDVQRSLAGYNLAAGADSEEGRKLDLIAQEIIKLFEEKGIRNWIWQTPMPGAY